MSQLDRDQETNALLAGDVRRAFRITMIAMAGFAVLLSIGSLEAGYTLIWVVGVPLMLLALLARLLARWCGDASVEVAARRPTPRSPVVVGEVAESAPDGTPPPVDTGASDQLVLDRQARCRVRPARPRLVVRRPLGWRSPE